MVRSVSQFHIDLDKWPIDPLLKDRTQAELVDLGFDERLAGWMAIAQEQAIAGLHLNCGQPCHVVPGFYANKQSG